MFNIPLKISRIPIAVRFSPSES